MEGGTHTAKRTTDVLWGARLPPYIKEEGRRLDTWGGQGEGSPTRIPVLVGFAPPPFSYLPEGERGKERE